MDPEPSLPGVLPMFTPFTRESIHSFTVLDWIQIYHLYLSFYLPTYLKLWAAVNLFVFRLSEEVDMSWRRKQQTRCIHTYLAPLEEFQLQSSITLTVFCNDGFVTHCFQASSTIHTTSHHLFTIFTHALVPLPYTPCGNKACSSYVACALVAPNIYNTSFPLS